MNETPLSFGICGSGTAGLISSIMLRSAFPQAKITIISSSEVGIVGVGEGSTEHWRTMMTRCDIPLLEMMAETKATHKYGIRFENWSTAFPDYIHSVSGDEEVFMWRIYAVYSKLIADGKLLTNNTGSVGLFTDKISKKHMHNATNQYHFDTFKLNEYFRNVAARRRIGFIEGFIEKVNLNPEQGHIESVELKSGKTVSADFWIDATGFQRILSKALGNTEWESFSKYLLADSAFAFPTEKDESGKIRTYTRARALSSGWMWEIPTQERRGNGYVYSSAFLSQEDALKEASQTLGIDISPARTFKFDPGHLKTPWVKNCLTVGLAGSFVEPLEATSIGSTILQMDQIMPFLGSYKHGHSASQKLINKNFNIMMDNILIMIRLHYMSDRRDTEFWRATAEMPVNDSLQELLDLWQETTLPRDHISSNHGEMFQLAHLLHVAQGQNVINTEPIGRMFQNFGTIEGALKEISNVRNTRLTEELVDHAEALNEIYN
jgi:tryptophan halogenase